MIPDRKPNKNRFTILWVGLAILVLGIFASAISDNSDGRDSSDANASANTGRSTSTPDVPTHPQHLAATLELSNDATFKDPNSYREVDDADFKKIVHPSGDLATYPYPYVNTRIIVYGEVDELAAGFDTATGGTYVEATVLNYDLGTLADWDLDSRELPIFGSKAELGDLKPGDAVKVFVEVRRPFLTGEEVLDSALRDPFLVAHIVEKTQ